MPEGSPLLPDELNELGRSEHVVTLIRHARRQRIADATASAAFSAPLTPTGREEARAFGAALLTSVPLHLSHSVVPRCEDTATCIAEGFARRGAKATMLGPRHLLSAAFVKDELRVIDAFARLGLRGFITAWFHDELPSEMVLEARQAGRELLEGLSPPREEAREPALEINVSHDIVIVALLGLAWDVASKDFPWPGYLEGVVIRATPGGASLRYRGEERSVDLSTPQERGSSPKADLPPAR